MMNIPNMVRKAGRASLLLIFGAALAGCNAPSATQDATPPLAGAKIGGPFSLTDQDGKPVRDSDFAGRYRIVYFGYSYCPDICPVDVQKLMRGLAAFEKTDPARGAKVQPMFITVDPARDTPAVLKAFVSRYHPRLIGLTGSEAALAEARAVFQVEAGQVAETPEGAPLYAHGSFIYLVGRDGVVKSLLPPILSPERIAELMRKYL